MMHPTLRLLAQSCATGFALGVSIGIMFVSTNLSGLRELLWSATDGWIGIAVLLILCGFSFASASMGLAMMAQATDDSEP